MRLAAREVCLRQVKFDLWSSEVCLRQVVEALLRKALKDGEIGEIGSEVRLMAREVCLTACEVCMRCK